MHSTKGWDVLAVTLIIIGAINWGLIGFFRLDLVSLLFGGQTSVISRIVYAAVGIAGLYGLTIYGKLGESKHSDN